MIRHKEWITPLYNGHPWFEKPILVYWLCKPAVMAFGQDFGPRLPSVLATIGTYAIVAWFARRRIGAMAAVMSLFVLGSSLLVVILGRMMMTDAPLLFFFTAAMLCYWESIVGDPRWKLVTVACLGLGVLAKGPIAIILFLLIAGWNAFFNRRSRIADRESNAQSPVLIWLSGVVILFAVIATWYVPAYIANGQTFVQEFLIKQNIGRFTGGDQAHTLPLYKSFWFYIPILLVGMLPWILWLPNALKNRFVIRDPQASIDTNEEELALRKFLISWAVVVFIFFTISGAKLAHYVLPCCPPIAILIGWHLAAKWKPLTKEQMRPKLAWTIAWLVVTWVVSQFGSEAYYVRTGQEEAHQMAKWIDAGGEGKGQPVATYQLLRRNKDRGTGKLEIQESSLPSLSFYLDRDVYDVDRFEELKGVPRPLWIFTRVGRIPLDQIESLNTTSGTELLLPKRQGKYYEDLQLVPVTSP